MDYYLLAVLTTFPVRPTAAAILGVVARPIPQINESAKVGISKKDHVTAMPAVSPIGPATGNELLTSQADDAVSAVAGLDLNIRLVDKHRAAPLGRHVRTSRRPELRVPDDAFPASRQT